jgi:hypothetical protein
MTQTLVGIFLTLLPEPWRRRWQVTTGETLALPAAISGGLELAVCLMLFVVRYLDFAQKLASQNIGAALQHGAAGPVMAVGVEATLEYLLGPVTILLVCFTIEGALRFYAAAVIGDVAGTFPLFLVSLAWTRLTRARTERALGPHLVDEVILSPGANFPVVIASCRRKEGWNRLVTVKVQDELYEVAGEQKGVEPRPYVYLLRKLPPGKVIRGLHHYSPDEVLTEKERRQLRAAPPRKPEIPPSAAPQS